MKRKFVVSIPGNLMNINWAGNGSCRQAKGYDGNFRWEQTHRCELTTRQAYEQPCCDRISCCAPTPYQDGDFSTKHALSGYSDRSLQSYRAVFNGSLTCISEPGVDFSAVGACQGQYLLKWWNFNASFGGGNTMLLNFDTKICRCLLYMANRGEFSEKYI